MNSNTATNNTRTNMQSQTNKFFGKLPLPQDFRKHRELVAGEASHARKITAKVGNGFRITLYNNAKGPETKVSFRECNMIRLSAYTADSLRQGAELVKQAIAQLCQTTEKITKLVPVDREKVGHVIGKGGETIKGIAKKVGEGTRIQYHEEKGGFLVSGYKMASVDWAASLVKKQADAFKVPVKPAVSTEVDLAESLFTYQQYEGQQKNQEKWDVRKKMSQEIDDTTGEKVYKTVADVPWDKVDKRMAEMEKAKDAKLAEEHRKFNAVQQAKAQEALQEKATFPEKFKATPHNIDEMWTKPSAMVFDPTARAPPPPPPPPAPKPIQVEEEEVELDGWERDANENTFTGGDFMANVDPEKLAEEQRSLEMEEEYEEFMRLQYEDEAQREMEESHYDELEQDDWHRF